MTIPAWPASVPYRPDPGQWSVKPVRAALKTDMEAGNVRIRRRPGDRLQVMQWGRMLSTAEMTDFRTFLDTTTYGGVSRFTMQVTLDGASYVSRVVQIDPETIQIAHAGGTTTLLSMSLFVLPASVTG